MHKTGKQKIIYYKELRVGLQYAVNAGAEIAKRDILAYTDNDAICDPNWRTERRWGSLLFWVGRETQTCHLDLHPPDFPAILDESTSSNLRQCYWCCLDCLAFVISDLEEVHRISGNPITRRQQKAANLLKEKDFGLKKCLSRAPIVPKISTKKDK